LSHFRHLFCDKIPEKTAAQLIKLKGFASDSLTIIMIIMAWKKQISNHLPTATGSNLSNNNS